MSVGIVDKQTGDRIPTAGMPAVDSVLSGSSTNPVQNRVVKAALDEKQDAYETITYAEWQAMTPEQQAAKDYYISNYPASVLTAGNIAYDNTSSGMAANKVQGAIDELKSGLTEQLIFNVTLPATTNGRSSVQLADHIIPQGAKVVGCIIDMVSTYSDAVSITAYKVYDTLRVTMIGSVDEVPQITCNVILGITY